MRICTTVRGVAPNGRMTGAATYDYNILAGLAGAGARVDVLLPRGRVLSDGPVPDNLCVITVPVRIGASSNAAVTAALARAVARHIRATRPHVWRVQSFFSSVVEALLASALCGKHTTMVMHFHHRDLHPLRKPVLKAAIRMSSAVICFSEAARGDLETFFGVPREKVSVIPHGVDRRFQAAPKDPELARRFGIAPTDRVLLYLGALEERKNPLWLIRALQPLLAGRRNVKLLICGSGRLENALRERIRSFGLQGTVVMGGEVEERTKVSIFNLADVFVMPSTLEGFGLAVAEAMSCGKPVVSFRVSSMPEIIQDGISGFLVDPFDAAAFRSRVDQLLCHDELRFRMGRAAASRVDQRFRWERAAVETLAVYQRACGQGVPPR